MKIAMIGQKGIPATFGGVERHVEELSAHLVERGHRVTAFVRPGYTAARGTYRGVRLQAVPSVPTKHLDAITHAALCTAAALCGDFDIVHYHAAGPALLSPVARCLGRRVVATVHAADWERAKWGRAARWFLRLGAAAAGRAPHETIVVSRALGRLYGGPGRRVTWIPNGVAELPRPALEGLRRFGATAKGFVLWMGRFTPEKRCEDLIDAFRATDLEAKLLLAAEAPEGDTYVRRLRERAGGDARIVFAGGLYGRDKAEALSHAALVVLPSEVEGFPIALLEGMRAGACVLASDIEAAREIVEDGRTGMLFPVGDAAALRRRMEWAFAHADAAAALGERARAALGDEYDWGRIAERTERVYEAALGRGRGSPICRRGDTKPCTRGDGCGRP